MFCKVCGEVMVFGPAGCACTRKNKAEQEQREIEEQRKKLEIMFRPDLELYDE